MPNKDRNKRSVRKARAAKRAQREAAQAAQARAAAAADPKQEKRLAKAKAKEDAKIQKEKADKDKKPGVFKRIGIYLGEVRTEMRRVVWPSREELRSYSVAVIGMLVVFGVVLWLVDSGIVALLAGFTSLRG